MEQLARITVSQFKSLQSNILCNLFNHLVVAHTAFNCTVLFNVWIVNVVCPVSGGSLTIHKLSYFSKPQTEAMINAIILKFPNEYCELN